MPGKYLVSCTTNMNPTPLFSMSYVVTLPLNFAVSLFSSFANAAWSCGMSLPVTSRLL